MSTSLAKERETLEVQKLVALKNAYIKASNQKMNNEERMNLINEFLIQMIPTCKDSGRIKDLKEQYWKMVVDDINLKRMDQTPIDQVKLHTKGRPTFSNSYKEAEEYYYENRDILIDQKQKLVALKNAYIKAASQEISNEERMNLTVKFLWQIVDQQFDLPPILDLKAQYWKMAVDDLNLKRIEQELKKGVTKK